nr:DUF5009 domain-containing protein [Candidatus Sigynarchaeota archaeon]
MASGVAEESTITTTVPAPKEQPTKRDAGSSKPTRLGSLDALRGFDMFWISGGTDFFLALFRIIAPPVAGFLGVQFNHPAWNGFTFYDLIFPLFIFMSGLSIPLSINKRLERGDSKAKLYKHVAVRTLLLFLLGALNNGAQFDPFETRFAGVLQRIAICSCVASIIAMNTRPRTQVYIAGGILLAYWAIMALIPVPGFSAGDYSPEGNLAGYIDRLLLPYPDKWCCYGFGDSEGILGTLPAISTALLGVLAGHWLRADHPHKEKCLKMIYAGGICLGLGTAWNFAFPINKYMWTSSYVLFTGGWSMLLVVLFYWIIDVRGHKKWAFYFSVIGMNSILMYMFRSTADFDFLVDLSGDTFFLPLVAASMRLAVNWFVLYLLYRKKWFLKL